MTHPGERTPQPAEVAERKIILGVNLRDYGTAHTIRRPIRGTPIERQEVRVMVDASHVRGHQLLPVEETYRDTRAPGAAPVAETSYGYAERSDGTVVLQSIQQLVRTVHGLEGQRLDREFREDGTVAREQVEVDRGRRRERIYAITWFMEGKMIYDNIFDTNGRLVERFLYFRPAEEKEWRTRHTRYTSDEQGQYHEEVAEPSMRLSGPPPLLGEHLRPEVPAPELPYEEPEPVFSFENTADR